MRRAIVTGCSSGIGRAVTEMLLADGWDVVGVSRTDPHIQHERLNALLADVASAEMLKPLTQIRGDISALIHCAGIRGPYGPLMGNDEAEWIRTIQTNLIGAYRVVKASLPALQRSQDGRILLFSGGGAFGPSPGFSAYAASKGGTVSLMESLAVELIDSPVTVNCVAPGFVATPIHAGTPHESRDDHGAMQRAVACVRHLLSPQAYGLSGRTISAQFDDWEHLTPWTIPHLGDQGTRTRHLISDLEKRVIRARRTG